MLRARLSDGSFILGLDAENLKRLQAGQPIWADLTRQGGSDRVMIVYGNTLQDIARELEEAAGEPLPPPTPLARGH